MRFYQGFTSGRCDDILEWDLENDVKFDFRLKLNPNYPANGELLVIGPKKREIVFDAIFVNEEIRAMDDQIIACCRIDHQWVFERLITDRKNPNARRTVEGILNNQIAMETSHPPFMNDIVVFHYVIKFIDKLNTFENHVTRDQLLASIEKSRGLE